MWSRLGVAQTQFSAIIKDIFKLEQMEEATIITATPDHLDIVVDFTLKMIEETENRQVDPKPVIEAWKHILSSSQEGISQDGRILLRKVKGQIIGLLRLFAIPEYWTWVRSVYVKPAYRNQGHFKALFQEALRLTKLNGFKQLRLAVHESNQKARTTYGKLGLKLTGEREHLYEFTGPNPFHPAEGRFKALPVKDKEEADSWCQDKQNILNGEPYRTEGWGESFEVFDGDKRVGFSRHFYFFDNFDNAVSPFIRDLYLQQDFVKFVPEVVHGLLYALKQSYSPLTVFAVLLIFRGNVKFIGGELQPYLPHSLPFQ